MHEKDNNLRSKLGILESLNICEEIDAQMFKRKVEVLKDVALILVNEIEALNYVRPVNISEGINLHEEMRMFEVHLIQSALERTGGHQTRAAQLLGINLTTLHNKLKRLNISAQDLVNAPIIHEDTIYKNTLAPLGDDQFSPLAA
ncbi:MAG TPA: helix-turn-helix domain-containing protein [Pyrinomonadaceae bacterium]|nr:helix-turn-helix domain-containing protein [Pyrinomonadaceae bacterium]